MTSCVPAPSIARGSFTYYDTVRVKYACDEGYSLHGFELVTCSAVTGWDLNDLPHCLISWSNDVDSSTTIQTPVNVTSSGGIVCAYIKLNNILLIKYDVYYFRKYLYYAVVLSLDFNAST